MVLKHAVEVARGLSLDWNPADGGQCVRPGQERIKRSRINEINVGQLLKQVRNVRKRLQPVLLRGFNDAVCHGAGPGTTWRVGEQPVFPANDERFD